MPPVSVKVMGNVGVMLAVKAICPPTEMLGSPLIIRFDTEQFVGVMVNWPVTEPAPELFRVPSMSPVTDIVPPAGPVQGSPIREIGQLQFSPDEVDVHPLEVSQLRLPTAADRLGRVPVAAVDCNAFPRDSVRACTTWSVTAWAWAGDMLLLLEPPQQPSLRIDSAATRVRPKD